MSERKYMAFDIEIAKAIPEGESDWKAHRPLGISCAATASVEYSWCWFSHPDIAGTGSPRREMTQPRLGMLVRYLVGSAKEGHRIVTWNGLGFDFDILAEESHMKDECKQLAYDHIDMMFQIFCLRGHALSLDKAAKGMGLAGKTEGVDGSLAPRLWVAGEHQRVLDYVAQDVRTTLELARAVEEAGYIEWVSSSGNRIRQPIERWLTVRECLELPEPDTSWMQYEPWPRSKFAGWLGL